MLMSQRAHETAYKAFTQRNNPSLPQELCAELTRNGVGILDWGVGRSWDPSKASKRRRSAAKKSFEAAQFLNNNGGYGVIHTEGFEEFTIGRVEPPCIRFEQYTMTGGEERYFTLFECDTYATIDDVRTEFPEVHEFARNRTQMETLHMADEDESNETSPKAVTDAYIKLDIAGHLE